MDFEHFFFMKFGKNSFINAAFIFKNSNIEKNTEIDVLVGSDFILYSFYTFHFV